MPPGGTPDKAQTVHNAKKLLFKTSDIWFLGQQPIQRNTQEYLRLRVWNATTIVNHRMVFYSDKAFLGFSYGVFRLYRFFFSSGVSPAQTTFIVF